MLIFSLTDAKTGTKTYFRSIKAIFKAFDHTYLLITLHAIRKYRIAKDLNIFENKNIKIEPIEVI